MIELNDLHFSYGENPVLQGASFTIKDGSIVALHGQSGIGKSTIARILTGLAVPHEGEVLMDGRTLVSSSSPYDRSLGLGIQMVYQQPHLSLDPMQKVGKGLEEVIRFHRLAPRGKERELAEATAASVGLRAETLHHLPRQISGGEAQRVVLSKALLFSPRLLILDEATSMLDMSTQANVLGLVKREMEEKGGSILLITHYLRLAQSYADKIILLEEGKTKELKS